MDSNTFNRKAVSLEDSFPSLSHTYFVVYSFSFIFFSFVYMFIYFCYILKVLACCRLQLFGSTPINVVNYNHHRRRFHYCHYEHYNFNHLYQYYGVFAACKNG
jgi:hypothetical protein